jgi:uncharacterized ferritin-like protein (DUF455 family)
MDVDRIVKRFGGVNELHHRLLAKGVDVNPKTIEKWRERRRIPSWRLLQIIALAKEEGAPIEILDYATN